MQDLLAPAIATKYRALQARLTAYDRVAVALSGGVDSSTLLVVACATLGSARVWALTAVSAFTPAEEAAAARALCAQYGVALHEAPIDVLADPVIAANPPDRCYHCKRAIFTTFRTLAADAGMVLVDGSNVDDLSDIRPGARALAELAVRSPLLEAECAKEDVRAIARAHGLACWDHPSSACLASRVPYGDQLTHAILARIGDAERLLGDLGFRQRRVRHHGNIARIELTEADLSRALDPATRTRLLTGLRALGYTYICLDLQGYRMGSLNETLIPSAGPSAE